MCFDMLGFRQYRKLQDIKYVSTPPVKIDVSDVRKKHDDLLDIIFSVDPLTNMPSGSIEQYLSDKTSDEVRTFIERNLLCDLPDTSSSLPSSLRDDLRNLDGDFIAKVARNPYEDRESYEERVSGYFREIEQDKAYQKRLADLRKKYKDNVKS